MTEQDMEYLNVRNRTFCVIWLSYASLYFLRKPFGVTKNALSLSKTISSTQLGLMDAAFLFPYAIGQILLGNVWEKANPNKVLALSMTTAATAMVAFPYCSSWYVMSGLLFCNGLAQSQCWPAVCRVTSSLFSGDSATTAFGVLSTSAFAGALLATTFTVFVQENMDWSLVYPLCSLIVVTIALLVCVTSIPASTPSDEMTGIKVSRENTLKSKETIGWRKILSTPMVLELCVIMFCLKLARYSIYMWLPMYFTVQMNYSEYWSGMLSTVFDIGGVLGSLAIGPLINRVFHGISVQACTTFVALSALSFLVFTATGGSTIGHVICLLLAGAGNSGPDGILAGSIPADIGQQYGSKDLSGAIYGLVNGFGSIGSVVEGPLMGWLSRRFGWNSVIDTIIIVSFLGCLVSLKLSVKPGIRAHNKDVLVT